MSSRSQPACRTTLSEASAIAVTARRNTSEPSMTSLVPGLDEPGSMVPSFGTQSMSATVPSTPSSEARTPAGASVAWMTTAPAPSPKRMHVARSVKSTNQLRRSTPTSNTVPAAPERTIESANTYPYTNPEQLAFTSSAPALTAPSLAWTYEAEAGIKDSGVHVALMIRSTSAAGIPAAAIARRAANSAISEAGT